MNAITPRGDDCIRCGRPFWATDELASLPNAKRIAFDPELERVWRICTHCGHWNLVGQETRSACIAELRARLPLSDRPAIGFDTLGRIEVLVVSTQVEARAANVHGLKMRRFLKRGRWLRPLFIAATFVAMVVIELLDPGGTISPAFWQMLGITAVAVVLGGQVRNWALRRPMSPVWLGAGLVGAIALIVVVPHYSEARYRTPTATIVMIAIGVGVMVVHDLLMRIMSVHTTDGTRIRISPLALRNVTLSRSETEDTLTAHGLRGGRSITGPDVGFVIATLGMDDFGKATADEVEAGWLLLRRSGSLGELMAALDDARPDDTGRHAWHDLPTAWRVAFLIGTIEAAGSEQERERLRRTIKDASEVASLADGLEDEVRES